MPLYDYSCWRCGLVEEDVLVRPGKPPPMCPDCDIVMNAMAPLTASPVFGPGRSAESKHEWGLKEKERLTKRSLDYDKSAAGQAEREKSVDRLRKNGNIPPGWLA